MGWSVWTHCIKIANYCWLQGPPHKRREILCVHHILHGAINCFVLFSNYFRLRRPNHLTWLIGRTSSIIVGKNKKRHASDGYWNARPKSAATYLLFLFSFYNNYVCIVTAYCWSRFPVHTNGPLQFKLVKHLFIFLFVYFFFCI